MAKGTESKNLITEKLLATFEGSFISGKEIRIPCYENGEQVQIKVTLTAAKDAVPRPDVSQNASMAASCGRQSAKSAFPFPITDAETAELPFNEPTPEETATLKVYMERLGLA